MGLFQEKDQGKGETYYAQQNKEMNTCKLLTHETWANLHSYKYNYSNYFTRNI